MQLGKSTMIGVLCTICLCTFTFHGCSNKQEVSKPDVKVEKVEEKGANKIEVKNTEKNTEKSAAEENAVPETTSWKVVGQAQISHPTYFTGFYNANAGMTVGLRGEIHYTGDGGKTWPQAKNSSLCRYGLDIVNDALAWSCGNGGHVRITNDAGKTWTAAKDFGGTGAYMSKHISFIDDKKGWIASTKQFATTKDGAKTWNESKLPDGTGDIAAISLRSENDGYILNSAGTLFITSDGGTTWAKQSIDMNGLGILSGKLSLGDTACAAIRFTDINNGIVIVNGMDKSLKIKSWIAETSDGGKSWKYSRMPVDEKNELSNAFITHDGKFITLSNAKFAMVFQK
ncbi:MAG: YCF48-related protein, partial [Clostridia bacterium]|nr:YCF48-related protein [Clostridia bacterium]